MQLRYVLTLGPATSDEAILSRLLATADRVRLNASHVSPDELDRWLARLAALQGKRERPIPAVVDLQGAKMRLGDFPAARELPPRVVLRCQASTARPGELPVPHRELFEVVAEGDDLTLADGRVRLRVDRVGADAIDADVVVSGPLARRQGINRRAHPIPPRALCDADVERVRVANRYPFAELAYSFVVTGHEAALLREVTDLRVAAKLERPEALAALQAIDSAFDELWLCRGDLGEQAGLGELGPAQRAIADAIPRLSGPVYLAGQVLHHMTEHDAPTRTEVVHLHDADRAGFAGIVLSDETAIGRHPLAVLELLDRARSW